MNAKIEVTSIPSGLSEKQARSLVAEDLASLMERAQGLRDDGHGRLLSYSRKVFIPLTQLCRDVCHYCTFAQAPKRVAKPFLSPEEVLQIARSGQAAGCREALFTLGDKPELRYREAREALAKLGYASTLDYLAAMAKLVYEETGLLPHLNPGVMTKDELESLRLVSVSMGIMLESSAVRLMQKGGCHYGSPDKDPEVRLATIAAAGELKIPFTSGILIGIGETRLERIESLLDLRRLHEKYNHIQEIIIQNFRAKPGTKMANSAQPNVQDLQWTIAVARLIFGANMSIQAPPNLSAEQSEALVAAGINDWGGISPVTPDHVNPEAPWPQIDQLAKESAECHKILVERLGIYPAYAQAAEQWLDKKFRHSVLNAIDANGFVREDNWVAGLAEQKIPNLTATPAFVASRELDRILARCTEGQHLEKKQVVRMFSARDGEVQAVMQAADEVRQRLCGDTVSYVVTRNINYTNICSYRCKFCAFAKGKKHEKLRGKPYNLALETIVERAVEAWDRGAVEVCLQGGIHPAYTGQTYVNIVTAIKQRLPDLHVHGFSPLEIYQGAQTLGVSIDHLLGQLVDAGLGSLPGTAAEILDDQVRARLCPDKITSSQWLEVMDTAHRRGIKTTATIMYGHIEQPKDWATHLLRLRRQQMLTGGFTELVPLPFVHMESPIYLKGASRKGPTWREAVLMHAVGRLVLNPHITNIQGSWVKLGPEGLAQCLRAGVNDVGGTLMDETITRSAGAEHGQEMTPVTMEEMLVQAGRPSRQRTTLYRDAPAYRTVCSLQSA